MAARRDQPSTLRHIFIDHWWQDTDQPTAPATAGRCSTKINCSRKPAPALIPREWPDPQTPPANWHDVVKKLVLLMRRWGYGPRDIADAMSQEGLPTSRSRIDALRGNARRVEVTPAELVVMLDSIIDTTNTYTDTDTDADHVD